MAAAVNVVPTSMPTTYVTALPLPSPHGGDSTGGHMTPEAGGPPIPGTITICTRARAALLRRCLASLESSIAEPGQLEVVIVYNGSSDATNAVAHAWAAAGPDRRVVVEPRPGLSRARN